MTESRNKREGKYCGRAKYCRKTGGRTPGDRHYRQGSVRRQMSLRGWEKQKKEAVCPN